MSTNALIWAHAQTGLAGSAKAILYELAGYHNAQTGRCFPSIRTIARNSGKKPQTIIGALRQLANAGLITITTGPRQSHAYTLHIDADEHKSVAEMGNALHHTSVAENGTARRTRQIRSVAENGTAALPKTATESVTNLNINTPLPPKGEPDEIRTAEECATGRAEAQRILAEILSTKPMRAAGAHRPMKQNRMTRHRTLAEDLNDRSWATP